ncbi:MAG: class I SAM-dependent RNA methyltransferase [Christensenellaceae bacterium]|nr:class I SAM-dependent RNA methyltransferase [Christensenellaceae bacterium]
MKLPNNHLYRCYASCSFGLESVVQDELRKLEATEISAQDGRVYFSADKAMIAKANCRLLSADRIYIVLSEFPAKTFDELFENVRKIDWADYLPSNADFPVTGDAVRSQLMSVSDMQSISKKAIVEALKRVYDLPFFAEDGVKFPVHIFNFKDIVTVSLNTSGAGLNRRSYRKAEMAAPLRENLAAGLIKLTRWRDRPFYDIMCGSGTIVIEAAMMARGVIPGLLRRFASEYWDDEFKKAYFEERTAAKDLLIKKPDIPFYAFDLDKKALEAAKTNAAAAHVADLIYFGCRDARKFVPETTSGTIITNPPYAMRMGEKDEVESLYRDLGKKLPALQDFKYYIIAADEKFEEHFGKKADKKRKLYNGNSKCFYYQYFKN